MRVVLFCICIILSATFAMAIEHSVDMGNMECVTCHADPDMVSKPEVVQEYNASVHSYAGVTCGNCHGDENDFMPRPRKVACEPCHTDQVAAVNSKLPCERCHTAHTFNVHGR